MSTVNDDLNDNAFREPMGCFSNADENGASVHLPVADHETWPRREGRHAYRSLNDSSLPPIARSSGTGMTS
ncbi:D-lyxose/D-mannose family sugar isomerase [Mesorhizobium sp. ORM6]